MEVHQQSAFAPIYLRKRDEAGARGDQFERGDAARNGIDY